MVAIATQLLGSNQSKTADVSLAISPASKTVTVGNYIFVAFASDDVGSAFGITDNLGNTYIRIGNQAVTGTQVKTTLWIAAVTIGGSITTITMSWTTNITAKAIVAGEFGNFGPLRLTENLGNVATQTSGSSFTFTNNELWIAALGVEDDVASTLSVGGTPTQTAVDMGSNGTTGGLSDTNISVTLSYVLINANSSVNTAFTQNNSGVQGCAAVTAIYNPTPPPAHLVPRFRGSGF